ncbi:hypothetical protein [Actinomadura alba]|uniref:Uncharacterized protein n=1 Tax=Actinomadura alba TaxID=406431 RepID=A0ABR7M3G7_9ACTN|nr:hypothetical protein [Actinomadura alba]MBC6471359.1 hypothetical protein [Actinomadura alba]
MIDDFERLMERVRGDGGAFGHREHLHLAWLAVREHGTMGAHERIGAGIRRVAEYAGRPQKYNATVTRAWIELVGHHVETEPRSGDFDGFLERHPALLDKRLLSRFYRSVTLASEPARRGWVEPDRAPFPWIDGCSSGA